MISKRVNYIIVLFTVVIVNCSQQSSVEDKLRIMENMVTLNEFKEHDLYDRHYFVKDNIAIGIYTKSGENEGKLKIVESDNLPVVMDGGCSVINVKFNMRTQQVLNEFCNGVG